MLRDGITSGWRCTLIRLRSRQDVLVSDQLQIRFEFLDELGRNSASLKIWRFTWLQLWLAGFEMCILEIVTSPDDSTFLAALEVPASV